jgi:hypothetical protein
MMVPDKDTSMHGIDGREVIADRGVLLTQRFHFSHCERVSIITGTSVKPSDY